MIFPENHDGEIPSRRRLFAPSLVAWMLAVALFGAGVVTCAQAQPETISVDCEAIAGFAAFMTTYRDTGAELARVVALLRARGRGQPDLQVYEAEVRRVWREDLPRDAAAAAAHRRCTEVLGQYPRTRDG